MKFTSTEPYTIDDLHPGSRNMADDILPILNAMTPEQRWAIRVYGASSYDWGFDTANEKEPCEQ